MPTKPTPKPKYQIKDFQWLIRSVFRDIQNGKTSKVWILGAGASVDSKIAGAGTLAHRWACELLNLPEGTDKEEALKQWKDVDSLKEFEDEIKVVLALKEGKNRRIDDFLSQKYFYLYSERFNDPQSGYAALREEMNGKLPSVGYLILAQLISNHSNLVITVNFDNLIADALFLTGKQLPLILDHENVAHLAKPLNDVTLVCKIHRDLLKDPMSSLEEMQELDQRWKAPLDEIFKYYSPIFIGYGGNDQTLMSYLKEATKFQAPPIWLHYTQLQKHDEIRKEVSSDIMDFLNKNQGILVPFTGFDRIMHYAAQELDLDDVLETFQKRSDNIRAGLDDQLRVLAEVTGSSAASDPIAKASVTSAKSGTKRSVSDWITIAESEKDPKKRLAIYDEAIAAKSHSWFFNNRGNVKADLGDVESAIKDYDEAIRLDPIYATAYNNRGILKSELGDDEGAIKDFDEAIRLNPKYAKAYVGRGNSKNKLRSSEGAIKDYDEAIRLDPLYSEAYNNRAVSKSNLGDKEGAIKDFDEAIRLDPKYATGYYNRGISKSNLGDKESAIKDYDEAIRLDPKYAEAYSNRGISKSDLGDEEGAIKDHDEAVRLSPKSATIYNNRGASKNILGDYEGALTDHDEAIRLDPKFASAHFNKACVFALSRRTSDAIASLGQAIALDKKYKEMSRTESDFDLIRDDPDFQALLANP